MKHIIIISFCVAVISCNTDEKINEQAHQNQDLVILEKIISDILTNYDTTQIVFDPRPLLLNDSITKKQADSMLNVSSHLSKLEKYRKEYMQNSGLQTVTSQYFDDCEALSFKMLPPEMSKREGDSISSNPSCSELSGKVFYRFSLIEERSKHEVAIKILQKNQFAIFMFEKFYTNTSTDWHLTQTDTTYALMI